jgi:hypothetical protein
VNWGRFVWKSFEIERLETSEGIVMTKMWNGSIGLILALLGANAETAQAGGGGAHGGVAVVCRDEAGEVRKIDLLDFVEFTQESDLELDAGIGMTEEQHLQRARMRLLQMDVEYALDFDQELAWILAHRRDVPEDEKLVLSGDTLPIRVSKKCNLEQIATYTGKGEVFFMRDLVERLSVRDRAGLLVHEAIYKLARKNRGAQLSTDARRITASLFLVNFEEAVDEIRRLAKRSISRPRSLEFEGGPSIWVLNPEVDSNEPMHARLELLSGAGAECEISHLTPVGTLTYKTPRLELTNDSSRSMRELRVDRMKGIGLWLHPLSAPVSRQSDGLVRPAAFEDFRDANVQVLCWQDIAARVKLSFVRGARVEFETTTEWVIQLEASPGPNLVRSGAFVPVYLQANQ